MSWTASVIVHVDDGGLKFERRAGLAIRRCPSQTILRGVFWCDLVLRVATVEGEVRAMAEGRGGVQVWWEADGPGVSAAVAARAREIGVEVGREGWMLGHKRSGAGPWETTAMAVWQECLPPSFPSPLSAPSRLVAVAQGGHVAGAVAYDHTLGLIRAFGVCQRFRRRGIGRLLLVAALEHIGAVHVADSGIADRRPPVPTAFCLHQDLTWAGAAAEPFLLGCGFRPCLPSAQPSPTLGVEFELVTPDFCLPDFAERCLFRSNAHAERVLAEGMLPVAHPRHLHPHHTVQP